MKQDLTTPHRPSNRFLMGMSFQPTNKGLARNGGDGHSSSFQPPVAGPIASSPVSFKLMRMSLNLSLGSSPF